MKLLKKIKQSQSSQEGYVLIAVMLLITLMIIAMSIEIPRIAQVVKRTKEEELVNRGKQYAMAIKRFYHKNGRYPSSIQQLEDTNHIRFLRKKYKDPFAKEDAEWHLVHVGEAQIKIPTPNPGLQGSGNPGLGNALPPSGGNQVPVQQPNGIAGVQQPGAQPGAGQSGQLGSLKTSDIGNGQSVGGGFIIGVASNSKAEGIKEFNEKTHYNEWLFVFDPRLEQGGGSGITVAAPGAAGAGSNLPPGSLGTMGTPTPSPK